jgi:hypothetical protein
MLFDDFDTVFRCDFGLLTCKTCIRHELLLLAHALLQVRNTQRLPHVCADEVAFRANRYGATWTAPLMRLS